MMAAVAQQQLPMAMPMAWPYTDETKPFYEAWLAHKLAQRSQPQGLAIRLAPVALARVLGYDGDVPAMVAAFWSSWVAQDPDAVPATVDHPAFH